MSGILKDYKCHIDNTFYMHSNIELNVEPKACVIFRGQHASLVLGSNGFKHFFAQFSAGFK